MVQAARSGVQNIAEGSMASATSKKTELKLTAVARASFGNSNNIATSSAEEAANTMVCLINQASYLLPKQLQSLEQKFLAEGGFTERMYNQRQTWRGKT
ncbi:MAG: four helix bundle suffix domain-containing protein [Acidobacteria bacterium]|nr:four helix bundle suffix domain-containing protein [Acidobacteriota bacterium]MBU4307302.1 four helix bundle suffix domain-containing protein [Acidobacteriota bacterium]